MLEQFRRRLARWISPTRTSQRIYAAAQSSRLQGDWGGSTDSSADAELVSSLRALRSRSRELCRDVSYARRARTLVVNNVIGQGIGLQAQVYNTRGELSARVNEEIEELWENWSQADSCHTGGRLDFSAFERALVAQIFEAGEVFVRKRYQPFGASTIPFALELIEAERLADELSAPFVAARNGNEIRMGIELDSFMRPVAYHIRKRHRSEFLLRAGGADEIERVPANQIIHLAPVDRWPQTRGVPWMAATLSTFKDMSGYVQAEVVRARVHASTPWTIESVEGASSFGEGSEDGDGSVEMTVEPGIAKRLNPGEKFTAPQTNSPNPALEQFMRYLLRDIAAGVGPSYESLSRDYSQSNYSSSRLALLDDRDLWRVFQSWFICSFRKPVHREWMQQAVLARSFTTFTIEQWAIDRVKFESVRFRPRGWGWVDPTKEVEAFKEAVRCNFMTQQDVVATSGADFEELVEQRKKELEMLQEAGIVSDTDPAADSAGGAPSSNTATEPAAPSASDANQAPADTESDSEQDPAARVFRFPRKRT